MICKVFFKQLLGSFNTTTTSVRELERGIVSNDFDRLAFIAILLESKGPPNGSPGLEISEFCSGRRANGGRYVARLAA